MRQPRQKDLTDFLLLDFQSKKIAFRVIKRETPSYKSYAMPENCWVLTIQPWFQFMDRPQRRRFLHQSAGLACALPALVPTLAYSEESNSGTGPKAEHPHGIVGQANGQTMALVNFSSNLQFDQIPKAVIDRAKDTLADTLASAIFGSTLPWSQIIASYCQDIGKLGKSQVLGLQNVRYEPSSAALANGAFTHAFELDNLTKPNSGSHPGATVFIPLLALAQARGCTGKELLTAFVAGTEVMIRIGLSTMHSQEEHGFHAPGTTGPFGSAAGCARLMGLDENLTANAMGLAASCAGGLLEFAMAGNGAMVKRLHMGRAAQAGILSSSLAQKGFTGPHSALEGRFGFLNVFCPEHDFVRLTSNLGSEWLTLTTMHKRYACHITAHTPVESAQALKTDFGFKGEDIEELTIECNERSMRANNIPAPKDILLGQYSIPFCVALSMYRNPVDPRSFNDSALLDERIMKLCANTVMKLIPPPDNRSDMTSVVHIKLKNGQELTKRSSAFLGTPERPLDKNALREKFLLLSVSDSPSDSKSIEKRKNKMNHWFDRIQNLENENNLHWIDA